MLEKVASVGANLCRWCHLGTGLPQPIGVAGDWETEGIELRLQWRWDQLGAALLHPGALVLILSVCVRGRQEEENQHSLSIRVPASVLAGSYHILL